LNGTDVGKNVWFLLDVLISVACDLYVFKLKHLKWEFNYNLRLWKAEISSCFFKTSVVVGKVSVINNCKHSCTHVNSNHSFNYLKQARRQGLAAGGS